MADILIKGMELPKKGNIGLLLYSDGSVEICGTGSLSKPLYGVPVKKAVALPEHGRCIDADELEASDAILLGEEAWDMVHNAPTVLEADE